MIVQVNVVLLLTVRDVSTTGLHSPEQSYFSIANQEAVSQSAALLLRIKALALQKRPLFILFALVGRTAAILDLALLCAVQGAQCKTRELP